jgi:hypothetical protein
MIHPNLPHSAPAPPPPRVIHTHIFKPNDIVVPNIRRKRSFLVNGSVRYTTALIIPALYPLHFLPRCEFPCMYIQTAGFFSILFAWTRLRFALAQGVLESIAHSHSNETQRSNSVFGRTSQPHFKMQIFSLKSSIRLYVSLSASVLASPPGLCYTRSCIIFLQYYQILGFIFFFGCFLSFLLYFTQPPFFFF